MNATPTVLERTVLPRLIDAARTTVGIQPQTADGEEVDVIVVDFADAFKQLVINEEERRFLLCQAQIDDEDGFFVISFSLLWAIAGSLVRRRLAGWLIAVVPVDRVVGRRLGSAGRCLASDFLWEARLGTPTIIRRHPWSSASDRPCFQVQHGRSRCVAPVDVRSQEARSTTTKVEQRFR